MSSPGWPMSIPLTSPRLKFIHTNPGREPIPQRPPRNPPTPSSRSKSLEMLDEPENVEEIEEIFESRPPPLPRPRSRSLDGLLDDDLEGETPESCENLSEIPLNEKDPQISQNFPRKFETLTSLSNEKLLNPPENSLDNAKNHQNIPRRENSLGDVRDSENDENLRFSLGKKMAENSGGENDLGETTGEVLGNLGTLESHQGEVRSSENNENAEKSCPLPVPRLKSRQIRVEVAKITPDEHTRISSSEDDDTIECCDKNNEKINNDGGRCPNDLAIEENSDKKILAKARSCGDGLDENQSLSSFNASVNSLHGDNEQRRKRNFMNKCVSKMRSLIKK